MNTVIKEYRTFLKKTSTPEHPNSYSKTMKSIGIYKEQDPLAITNTLIESKVGEKLGHRKRASVDYNSNSNSRIKETPTRLKK